MPARVSSQIPVTRHCSTGTSLNAFYDCVRSLFRVSQPYRICSAVVDKKGLTGYVSYTTGYCPWKDFAGIDTARKLEQDKKAANGLCPTRACGRQALQCIEHRAATDFVKAAKLGQPPLYQA